MAKKDKKDSIKDDEPVSSQVSRKFKQNPALYVGSVFILVLITVTFVGGDFFSGKVGRSGADLTFGYYDKEPITWIPGNVFSQNQEQAAYYYQSQGMDMGNFNVAAQIWRQAFEATVVHVAILRMMKRSNYSVPERTVDRQVAQLPQFQENGRFSKALYQQMPESSRLALWREVQSELIKLNFFNDFFNGLLMPSDEAQFIGNMTSVMRTFEMVSFPVDVYPEDEYLAYAKENAGLFKSIHLSRITVNSSEREAKKILDSIKTGVITFEDAARAQSQDGFADRGGDMGNRYVFELENEIPNSQDRDSLLSLSRGEISNVIRIDNRWIFYRVEDALKPADFEDYSTMDKVRSYVRNFERGRMEDWAVAQANKFNNDVKISSFDDAVLWHSLTKNVFGPLPVNFGGVELFTSLESFEINGISSQDIKNLSNNENFWRIAFITELNTPSEPLVQGSNVFVLFPIEEINAEDSTALDAASLYSSYWENYISQQSIQYYFLNNPRMDDRFWDTYFRYFMP